MIKHIYAFRHGETDWNKEFRFQGRIDIPLNETGRTQALRLQKFFAKNPVEVFLTSDLGRAVETARIARGQLDVPIVLEPRIRETNLGQVEGLTHDEILTKFGSSILEDWRSIHPDQKHSRFPGGESKAEHLARMLDGLTEFLKKTDYQKIAISTHGGSLRRVLHYLHPDLSEGIAVGNCALFEMKFDSERGLHDASLEVSCALD